MLMEEAGDLRRDEGLKMAPFCVNKEAVAEGMHHEVMYTWLKDVVTEPPSGHTTYVHTHHLLGLAPLTCVRTLSCTRCCRASLARAPPKAGLTASDSARSNS